MTPVSRLAGLCAVLLCAVCHAAEPPAKVLPLPGESFLVKGRQAFVILPHGKSTTRPIPWVWYAPTLPGLPGAEERWMFERFANAGFAIAGIDVGESYGSPEGRGLYSALYDELTTRRGLASKAVMLGRSRGGLMTLSWAADNADKVAGFAGVYPVCSLASYPGVAKACGAYGMTEAELSAHLTEHNPVDRLAALAKAKVPFFAIHGDNDAVVPLDANSGELRKRYQALGGRMQLVVPKGQGHTMWQGFFQSQELVDFVLAVGASSEERKPSTLVLSSPLDHQVVQRSTKESGSLRISGAFSGVDLRQLALEIRITVGGKPGDWRSLPASISEFTFSGTVEAPAGGWHRVEVRATRSGAVLAESVVEHVGIGEVFVVAGQSNSANHGEEKQTVKTGRVATFDGRGLGSCERSPAGSERGRRQLSATIRRRDGGAARGAGRPYCLRDRRHQRAGVVAQGRHLPESADPDRARAAAGRWQLGEQG